MNLRRFLRETMQNTVFQKWLQCEFADQEVINAVFHINLPGKIIIMA